MSKKKDSSPGFVLVYLIPLLIYYFVTYKLYLGSVGPDGMPIEGKNPAAKKSILQLGLLVIVFLLIYGLVVKQMSKHCQIGSKNFGLNSFLYSFIPFVFIYGSLMVAMILLPGWKAPFSNTIGYFIVRNVIERKLFSLQEWVKIPKAQDSEENKDLSALKKFNTRHARTFFVNELTPDNFFTALKQVNVGPGTEFDFHPKTVQEDGQEVENVKSKGISIAKALYSAVIMKDIVSDFIWMFLGGVIAYSVAEIYAIDHICQGAGDKDDSSIQNRLKRQREEMDKRATEQAELETPSGVLDDDL